MLAEIGGIMLSTGRAKFPYPLRGVMGNGRKSEISEIWLFGFAFAGISLMVKALA